MPYFSAMSYLLSRFPSFYRFAAFVALLAMLVPLWTSLVHHPEAAQDVTHICDSGMPGMQGSDHSGKAPAHKTPSCPICQGLHLLSGGFVRPVVAAVAPVSFASTLYVSTERTFSVRSVLAPQARPRAPPIFV
jgi:hypothetical protein